MSIAALQIQIEALDRASRPIQKIAGEIEKLEKIADSTTKVGRNLQHVGRGLTAGVTAPIAAGLGLAAKTAIDFEEGMADAAKTLGTTRDETQALGQDLLAMTRTLPTSATGLAAIAAAGGQLGIAANDIQGFVEVTAKMGTAFDMSAEQAGDSIAKLMNVYSLNLDGVTSMGDAINHISNNSAASAGQIVDAATRIGGSARQFGLAETEALALAGAVIALGRPPEVAATAINGMLPILQTATGQTGKFQEGLAAAGLSATQLEQAIAQDAMGGVMMFLDSLGQMEAQQRALSIQKMFGTGSDAQVIAQLAADSSALAKNLNLVGEAGNFAGSMQAEFEARAATTANQLQLMKNAAMEIGITLGSAMLPAINDILNALIPMAQGFAEFAAAHPGITQVGIAISAIAAAIGPILFVIGGIIQGIGTLIGFLAQLKTAFLFVSSIVPTVLTGIQGFFATIVTGSTIALTALAALPLAILAIGARLAGVKLSFTEFFSVLAASVKEGVSRINEIPGAISAIVSAAVAILRTGAAQAVGAVREMGAQIISAIQSIASQAFSAGAQIVQRLAAGILSGIGSVISAAKSVASAVMSVLPQSPVDVGPLRALNNPATSPGAKIVDMLSAGMLSRAGQIGGALGGILSPAVSPAGMFAGGAQPAQTGSEGSRNSFVINLTVSENMADSAIDQLEQKIDELMGRYDARRDRLSYG